MPDRLLTGSRIRDRRQDRGLRQAELAAAVGISPSYLNLIEHNRRRIAGKLLHDIARELGVEPAMLAAGAEGGRVAALRGTGAAQGLSRADLDRADDLVARFPAWAALVEAQGRHIARLESRVAELSDRLSHDPALAAALHEVITAVTAIHSTAAILVEAEDLDRDWQARFYRNIHADSGKLSGASRALVGFLEAQGSAEPAPLDPQDEVERHLAQTGGHVPEIEAGAEADAVAAAARLSGAATWLLRRWLRQYATDAGRMPLPAFAQAARAADWDPAVLAARFGVPMAAVLRRLAVLPPGPGQPPMALVVADGAGAILHQKAGGGFALPRGGAACPLWPVFAALTQPGRPMRRAVRLPGERGEAFLTHAVAEIEGPPSYDVPPVLRATMLVSRTDAGEGGQPPVPVGRSCRICPRIGCSARREPSVMTDADDPAETAL